MGARKDERPTATRVGKDRLAVGKGEDDQEARDRYSDGDCQPIVRRTKHGQHQQDFAACVGHRRKRVRSKDCQSYRLTDGLVGAFTGAQGPTKDNMAERTEILMSPDQKSTDGAHKKDRNSVRSAKQFLAATQYLTYEVSCRVRGGSFSSCLRRIYLKPIDPPFPSVGFGCLIQFSTQLVYCAVGLLSILC